MNNLPEGKNHWNWKGGKPNCKECGKKLSTRNSSTGICKKCLDKNRIPRNSGKTHFKKGHAPWNKGKKLMNTPAMIHANELRRGVSMPKPKNFSETMRKVNPPKGIKFKYDFRDKNQEIRVWRHAYVFLYKPEHPTSRKYPPDYGYISEHRYNLEIYHKRPLKKTEVVHHIDGNKSNNQISNLLICSNQREHNKVHTAMETFVEYLIRKGEVYYDKKTRTFAFVKNN